MAAKRTHTIGTIIPTMENAIFARGLQAFQETLHDLGYNLLVSSSAYKPSLETAQIKTLVSRDADGLLLIDYERDNSIYEYLEPRQVPEILAWAYDPERRHPSVGFDNRTAMKVLTNKVISMGYRQISAISGIVVGNDRAANRLAGIKDGLLENGLDPKPLQVLEASYEIENGASAFATLMRADPKPSVVMCGNDVLAAGAISKAHELGLTIPGDVSITGFDDIELAGIAKPPLTTVHVPHREMGRMAAQELIDMIEGRSTGAKHQLAVSISERGSLREI